MKRKIRILLVLMLSCSALGGLRAQTGNYVKTIIPTTASTSTTGFTVENSIITYQYFDGLGRAQQSIQRGATPDKLDLATYQEYDA